MIAPLMSALLLFAEIAHLPDTRKAMWDLVAASRYGHARTEEAMFIVREADGRLSYVRWESRGTPYQARWNGGVPEGAVAIAHTHPYGRPHPSRADSETARKLGLPVYVLTRDRITRTDGDRAVTVVTGQWEPA